MRYDKCLLCHAFTGWIGLVVNVILMVMKGFIGLVSGSQALFADAMYSAKDVITSLLVIVSHKVSNKPLDREHPYGHGKIEFILALVISLVFLTVTALVFFHALELLWLDIDGEEHAVPHPIALAAALVSVLVNSYMYFYSRCVAHQVNSPMVRTLSKHHYADVVSSLAVSIGIMGALYLDMAWIDTTVALFETLHLMYLGGDVFVEAYRGLMDRSTSEHVYKKIRFHTQREKGVENIVSLRSRLVGQEIYIDLSIAVDPDISIEEANNISQNVIQNLSKNIPHVGFVNVKFQVENSSVPEVVSEQKKIKDIIKENIEADKINHQTDLEDFL